MFKFSRILGATILAALGYLSPLVYAADTPENTVISPGVCKYACQSYNPASKTCVGAFSNSCASNDTPANTVISPGVCKYSCQSYNSASKTCAGATSNRCATPYTSPNCPAGSSQFSTSTTCILTSCPSGYLLQGSSCVPVYCKSGLTLTEGWCK